MMKILDKIDCIKYNFFLKKGTQNMSTACGEIRLSLSVYLLKRILPGDEEPFYLQVGKSIGLILTSPIGLIEGVVRGLFALLAASIALFLPPSELRNWYQQHIFSPLALGSILSLPLGCLVSVSTGLGLLLAIMNNTLFKIASALGHLISPDDRIARMPPSIWCCCKNKEEIAQLG